MILYEKCKIKGDLNYFCCFKLGIFFNYYLDWIIKTNQNLSELILL